MCALVHTWFISKRDTISVMRRNFCAEIWNSRIVRKIQRIQ